MSFQSERGFTAHPQKTFHAVQTVDHLTMKEPPMPDTPPRMDREKLARVVLFRGAKGRVAIGDTYVTPFTQEAESYCGRINAAASAWLDREVKKVWGKAWKEVQAEEHSTVHINCPSCGFEGKGSVHATGIVKEMERAVDAETARCLEIARSHNNSGEGGEIARLIRSAPGKELKSCPKDCDGSSHPGQWHAKWDFPTKKPTGGQ